MVEAPLTGGLQLLKIGQMTILAGGPQDLIKYCTPLMRSYTDEKRILRMGDYGAASVVKIITNMLAGAHQVRNVQGQVQNGRSFIILHAL